MIEPLVAAYTAGMIDADGCIQINRRKRKDYHDYALCVSVSQSTDVIPLWLKRHFGGSIFSYTPKKDNRQEMHRWSVHCHKAVEVLQIVLPFLVLKSERAKISMELQSSIKRLGGGKKPSDEILKKRHELFLDVKKLNARHSRHKSKFDIEKFPFLTKEI